MRNMRKMLIALVTVAAAAAVYTFTLAQSGPTLPPIPSQPAPPAIQPAPPGQPVAPSPVIQSIVRPELGIQAVVVGANTFATVKDHGDSQTILVLKVDELGRVKMTDKKKFFY